MTGYTPAHDLSAERAVLGAALVPAAFDRLRDRDAEAALVASILGDPPLSGWYGALDAAREAALVVADFSEVRLAELYGLLLDAPADTGDIFGFVVETLDRRGRLALLGGANYLRRLRDFDSEAWADSLWTPGGADTIRFLAPALKRYTARRRALALGRRLARLGIDDGGRDEALDLLAEIGKTLSTWTAEAAA